MLVPAGQFPYAATQPSMMCQAEKQLVQEEGVVVARAFGFMLRNTCGEVRLQVFK